MLHAMYDGCLAVVTVQRCLAFRIQALLGPGLSGGCRAS